MHSEYRVGCSLDLAGKLGMNLCIAVLSTNTQVIKSCHAEEVRRRSISVSKVDGVTRWGAEILRFAAAYCAALYDGQNDNSSGFSCSHLAKSQVVVGGVGGWM